MGQPARLTASEKKNLEKQRIKNRKALDKQQKEKQRSHDLEQDVQELRQKLYRAYAVEGYMVVHDPAQLMRILSKMKVSNIQSSTIHVCTRTNMFERTELVLLNLGWHVNGKLLSEVGATSNYSEGGVYTVGEVMVQLRDADKICDAKSQYTKTLDTMKAKGFAAPNGWIPPEITQLIVPHDTSLSDDLLAASFRAEMSQKDHPELKEEDLVRNRDTIHILYLGSPLFQDGHPSWKVRKYLDYTKDSYGITGSHGYTVRECVGYTTGTNPPYNRDGSYTKEHLNELKTLEKKFHEKMRMRNPNGTQSRLFDKCTCDCSTRGRHHYPPGSYSDLDEYDFSSDCTHCCQCVYCTECRIDC